MKTNQAPTTSWEDRKLPELIKENPALVNTYVGLAKRFKLIEKGEITQDELDALLNQSMWEPAERPVKLTLWKILRTITPEIQMEDIML